MFVNRTIALKEERSMKSFSGLTKEELYRGVNENFCCDMAELMAMLLFGGNLTNQGIKFVTESPDVLGRYEELCRKIGVEADIGCSPEGSGRYVAHIADAMHTDYILREFGLRDTSGGAIRYRIFAPLVQNDCCRRAFIKGAFMSGGSIVDPNKNYNLEIVTPYMGLSRDFGQYLSDSGFGFKTIARKSKYVIYTKKSETIEDFLSYVGAYKAQMDLINIKIEKGIRNDFNRSVNSETANLDKTIAASVKQIQAIETIDRAIGLDNLPCELYEIATLRLKYKSMSLSELGKHLVPPLGKSGVNHRIQKIFSMAERFENISEE